MAHIAWRRFSENPRPTQEKKKVFSRKGGGPAQVGQLEEDQNSLNDLDSAKWKSNLNPLKEGFMSRITLVEGAAERPGFFRPNGHVRQVRGG
jgi:hypothetical protein